GTDTIPAAPRSGTPDRPRRRRAPENSACQLACPPSAPPVPACPSGRAGRSLACETGFSFRTPKISKAALRRVGGCANNGSRTGRHIAGRLQSTVKQWTARVFGHRDRLRGGEFAALGAGQPDDTADDAD